MDRLKRRGSGKIELRHLRYFLAVADEMSFARAAEHLGIAQPGLSQQIKILEALLDVRLFDRSGRSPRFTLAGELFYKEARKIMTQLDVATQVAQRAARGEVGRLAVGYVGSAAYTGMLTHVITEFRENSPFVELNITELEMLLQLDAIAEGRMDVGFIRPPVALPRNIETIPILFEELMLALSEKHPVAREPEVDLAALANERFIIPRHSPQMSFHHHTADACRKAGFEPSFGPQGRDFMTIASMVSIGLGVALVPQSTRCIQLPFLQYRSIKGQTAKAELAVAFRRGDHSPIVRTFISIVRHHMQRPDGLETGAPG